MYDKARAVFARRGGVPLAIVDYNRANIYANLNDLRQAKELYRAAAQRYERAGMELAGAQARYSLAYLLFLEDAFSRALQTFERIHETFLRLGDQRSAAVTQLDLAEINLRVNQYGSAVLAAETVAPLFGSLGMRYEEGKAHLFAAEGHMAMRNPARAARHLNVAARIFDREHNDLWRGMTTQLKALLAMSRGRFAQAEQTAQQAQQWFRRSDDRRRQIDARIIAWHAALRLGRPSAVAALKRLLRQTDLTSLQRFSIHEILGEHYFRQQQIEKALSHFQQAITLAEKMLSGLREDEIRFFFAANKYHVYARAVECLLILRRVKASWLLSMRALSLINSPMVPTQRLRRQLPGNLIDDINRLRRALNQVRRPSHVGSRGTTAEVSSTLEQRLWARERRARALVGMTTTARQTRGKTPDPTSRLKPGETLVNYVTMSDEIGAQVGTSEGVRFVPLHVKAEELELMLRKVHFICEQTVHGVRGRMSPRDALRDYLRNLYGQLVLPLEEMFGSGPLMIFAEGPVMQVPFAVLPDESGVYLSAKCEIRLLASPDVIGRRGRGRIRFERRRNAVFAVPSPSLPQVRREAATILELFPNAESFTGEAATAEALQSRIADCKGFVHIATHAARSSENPLFSRLLMADGPFFPFDLHSRGVTAELVVLSGCQTAAPGLYYDNAFSLAKAFHQAGARYVLASLWPVSDRLTMMFMRQFYNALKTDSDPSLAWRGSVNALLRETDDPAFWGAFVLLGA